MMNALEDILDFLMENAPTVGAVGGAAVSAALAMNPSLPMTTASGTPPGNLIYSSNRIIKTQNEHKIWSWNFLNFWC